MPNEDQKILLHDYFDELLSPEEEADFQTLLMENRSLAIELGKLKDLKRRLKNMPLSFEPPPKIINNITDKLLTLEGVQDEGKAKKRSSGKKIKYKKKKRKKHRKAILNIIIIILLLAIGGGGGYYFYYANKVEASWRVSPISGQYKIGNNIDSHRNISEEQIFKLGKNGVAEIYLNNLGTLHVDGKTELKVLSIEPDKGSISLSYGHLEYIPKPTLRIFQILMNDLLITSKNSKFKIYSDDLGDFTIEVLSNFLEIKFKGIVHRFAHDYVVKIEAGQVLKTPYSIKTSPEFIKLVNDYDYNHETKMLLKIIDTASKNDALTLHFLLSQVDPAKRELIIDKLNTIIPLPYDVDKSIILILNQQAMNKWWNEIYSTIY
ncbi:hypothetical protein MNBD_IGNAVI01-3119 [hydrothermal vent metagenome]|uniref:Uncharacterized protein n=1 Tax=hydrothermal vent metagenome TaxID=652676 RepID=A0A3B1BJ61_9ZZZZ